MRRKRNAVSDDISATVGSHLKMLRKLRGMTQEYVARKAGLSRPSLANIEAGKQGTSVELFFLICEAIGYEPHVTFRLAK